MKNPFRPAFGSIPMALAGREEIVNDILEGLENDPGDPNRTTIFVGARGTGKTALMAYIAERAESAGWIGVNVTSGDDILRDIMIETRRKAEHLISRDSSKRISGISAGVSASGLFNAGGSVEFEKNSEMSNWRSEMTAVIEELDSKDVGLLITVDEVTADDEGLKKLVDVFQHFIRERRNVALLLAGLPGNVSQMLTDKRISFLRRAFRRNMEAINITDVAYALKETIELGGRSISEEALWLAAEKTGGFAFLIQLLGYHMWRQDQAAEEINADDVRAAVGFAERDMDVMLFDVMISELTDREKLFVRAMSIDDEVSEIITIADRMGITPNNAVKIRKRLIERGVIAPRGRGKIGFETPMLAEFLRKVF